VKRAILVYAVLSGMAGIFGHGSAQETWRLGGEGGISWSEVTDFSLMVDDSTQAGALQPFQLKPDENLLPRLGPWQRWRFPTDPQYRSGHPRFWTDINHNSIYEATEIFRFVDGDPSTYVERRARDAIFYTIDLGTRVPVDRFVFFPPEGISPESDEPFRPNYILKSYSLTGNKAETGIMEEELERFFVWRGEGICCPLEVPLAYEERNASAITDINFPLQHLRFFRLIAIPDGFTLYGDPIVTRSAFAEMEVYGRGFAPKATWESQIVDLGREVNFGRVSFAVSKWRKEGDLTIASDDGPVRAEVEIRTGRDDTPTAYFGFDDLGGHVEVTKKQWDRLTPLEARGATVAVGFRGPVAEDQDNWSFWSEPLVESGQHPRLPWGRYFQLRVQLETDTFFDFARLDSLEIEIAPLLADRVVGEVVLEQEHQPQGRRVRVLVGEKTSFVYDIGVEFSSVDRTGFDALRVLTPSAAEFSWLQMGEPLSAVEPERIVVEDRGFVVFLPRRLSPEGDRRLRIGLETVLYGEAGEFGGEIFNRGEESLVQRVEGGDVSGELGSDQLLVVASASSTTGVLGEVEVGWGVFTPQGDAVNDQLSIQYTLYRVQQESQVKVGIYALDGQLMWQVLPEPRAAGRHTVQWDGRDRNGALVGPGVYLARVEVKTDKGSEVRMQTVSVVY